jgi:hypothetical protein
MTVQSDLIQYIAGLATAAGERIHDEQVPQKVPLPFVAIAEISGNRPTDISGKGLLKRSTQRIAIFSRSADERDTISFAISEAMRLLQEAAGGAFSIGATRFTSIRVETSSDEVALADGDNVIKGKGLDLFAVFY